LLAFIPFVAALLPDRPEVARAVHRLVARVHHDGGSTRLLRVVLPSQPSRPR
jgi:hypothetical protein